jgi:hypothetical protein
MIDFSIIVPSLHVDRGQQTLVRFLPILVENTRHPYELLLSSHADEGGTTAINQLAHVARADYLIILCDDQYVAPGWDEAFYAARDPETLLVGVLVESGDRPVASHNLEKNFGRTPETFDRAGFETMAAGLDGAELTDPAWGFPWCVSRQAFLQRGGIPIHRGDIHSRGDFYFWRDWLDDGYAYQRVPAVVYHLQAWTGREYDNVNGARRAAAD